LIVVKGDGGSSVLAPPRRFEARRLAGLTIGQQHRLIAATTSRRTTRTGYPPFPRRGAAHSGPLPGSRPTSDARRARCSVGDRPRVAHRRTSAHHLWPKHNSPAWRAIAVKLAFANHSQHTVVTATTVYLHTSSPRQL